MCIYDARQVKRFDVKEMVEAFMFLKVGKLDNPENSIESFIICEVKIYKWLISSLYIVSMKAFTTLLIPG